MSKLTNYNTKILRFQKKITIIFLQGTHLKLEDTEKKEFDIWNEKYWINTYKKGTCIDEIDFKATNSIRDKEVNYLRNQEDKLIVIMYVLIIS